MSQSGQPTTESVGTREKENMAKFEPSAENCTVCINVDHEHGRAYAVWAGSTGGYLHGEAIYEYVAKSICYTDELGNVFAPDWATRLIPFSQKGEQIRRTK